MHKKSRGPLNQTELSLLIAALAALEPLFGPVAGVGLAALVLGFLIGRRY
jgi:hypothetical protein